MIKNFVLYGLMGWVLEILWTGAHSMMKKEYKLIASTSIWMFFIYGLAAFITPICDIIIGYPVALRGIIYALCFFAVELVAGMLLKKGNACPWDYSDSKYNIKGVIRIDYIFVWFVAGLIFEAFYMNF